MENSEASTKQLVPFKLFLLLSAQTTAALSPAVMWRRHQSILLSLVGPLTGGGGRFCWVKGLLNRLQEKQKLKKRHKPGNAEMHDDKDYRRTLRTEQWSNHADGNGACTDEWRRIPLKKLNTNLYVYHKNLTYPKKLMIYLSLSLNNIFKCQYHIMKQLQNEWRVLLQRWNAFTFCVQVGQMQILVLQHTRC